MYERQAMESQQLLFALRDSPDAEATELLRRLRAGENVSNIIGSIAPQDQLEEQRVRSPSFAGSYSSAVGADTSMAFSLATTVPAPQAQPQLQQQEPVQPQQYTIPDRSRLAIDFLVNGNDETCTSTMQQSPTETAGLVATSSPHLQRLSSYPPITPASIVEQHRRLSAPLSNSGAPPAALPAATMQGVVGVVQGPGNDWANYHANVSSLFRSLGEPQRGPHS